MSFIEQISIKNFRSIANTRNPIKAGSLNIFVGGNDAGKSNVLRALNLFFNNQTDLGVVFNFDLDFSYHAGIGKGKAQEARIQLIISPPVKRFKGAKKIRWTKTWRRNSIQPFSEDFSFTDRTRVSAKSNIENWARSLEYHYIPAIKGKAYFSHLMGELHDVLSYAHAEKFKEQGEAFIGGIQDITEQITADLLQSINIGSAIQGPADFKVLFSNLDFGSRDGDKMYYLNLRGDGIKCRHIPVILKYIAQQKKELAIPGKIKPDAIWGFEEPENNLELTHAFQLAAEFLKISENIQIFLTTHSPAFYSLEKSDNNSVETYYVFSETNGESTIKHHGSTDVDLDAEMGMLPIITPFLEEIAANQAEMEELKTTLAELPQAPTCLVLTEDTNFDHIRCVLEASGFRMDEIQIESYKGAGNFDRALGVAGYFLSKEMAQNVLVYRDRDGLTNQEINKLRQKVSKIGAMLFIPDVTDVEAMFVSADHVLELYPGLGIEMVESAIARSIEDSKVESLKRLFQALSETGQEAASQVIANFHDDPNSFFFGKKVLNLLHEILREEDPEVDLVKVSGQLQQPALNEFCTSIWPID